MTWNCATWHDDVIRVEIWVDVNRKLHVAVSFNGYVESDENYLPCAEQETKQLCEEVTDKNHEVEKE